MDDLKQLALMLFEIEKRHLLEEKQEYSCAVVIVVTPEGRYYEEAEFNDEAEMDAVYAAIVERAKAKNATAIITINTGRENGVEAKQELDSYRWGQLAEGGPATVLVPHTVWAEDRTIEHESAVFSGK